MPTPCSMTIYHAEGTACVYLTHDGSPESALAILANVMAATQTPTSEELFEACLAQYSCDTSQSIVREHSFIAEGEGAGEYDGSWNYVVKDGQLTVLSHERFVDDVVQPVHPTAYVKHSDIFPDLQADVIASIEKSLQTLAANGVTLARGEFLH